MLDVGVKGTFIIDGLGKVKELAEPTPFPEDPKLDFKSVHSQFTVLFYPDSFMHRSTKPLPKTLVRGKAVSEIFSW